MDLPEQTVLAFLSMLRRTGRGGLCVTALLLLLATACAGRGALPEEPASGALEQHETGRPPAERVAEVRDGELLDASSVRRVVEAGESAVQTCYQSWLDRLIEDELLDPEAPPGGRMIVYFEIGADGGVEEVEILESDAEGPPLQRCIVAEVRRWRFPAPAEGEAPVGVEVPFFFAPMLE